MKLINSAIASVLCLTALQARAGHEVNDGSLETWYCEGTGLLKGQAGAVNLPFELRISASELQLTIKNAKDLVLVDKSLPLAATAVNYGNGDAELRSYKPSTSLWQDQAAYILIHDIGNVSVDEKTGSAEFSLDNGVSFVSHIMACKNYF